jgi:hypothetical protein
VIRAAARLCLGCLCAGALLLGACQKPEVAKEAAPAPAEATEGVALKPAEVQSMGIVTVAAAPAAHVPQILGFGVVQPHEAIAQAAAEVASAAATERQSRAALARAQKLAGTAGAMPADVLETAERQSVVDQTALRLTQQRLTATFGQTPPWGTDAGAPMLRSLADGSSKLVRVTFPLGTMAEGTPPVVMRLARIGDTAPGKGWSTHEIWSAPADAGVPGNSFFVHLQAKNLGEGERLLAWVGVGTAESGVIVPAASVLLSDGKYWCYVERKQGVFVRTELDMDAPVPEGYFVKDGIAPGDKLVTASAGLLLAREMNPSSAAD